MTLVVFRTQQYVHNGNLAAHYLHIFFFRVNLLRSQIFPGK